jgi:hypothetical protein
MSKARWLALVAALTSLVAAVAQAPVAGFAARRHGEVLRYHAPLPGTHDALLVRSIEAGRSIGWLTAAVPDPLPDPFVRFVWMFGLEATADRHEFELQVEGEPWFRFANPLTSALRDWTLAGPRGATLRFRATMVDRFDDLMGFAELSVPADACRPGRPVELGVVGESAGSRAWYMTFAERIEAGATLQAPDALLRGEGQPYRPVLVDIVHLGEPLEVQLESSFAPPQGARLEVGANRITLRHPPVDAPRELEVRVVGGGRELFRTAGRIAPVRPWTVDLVQHTHTDIGYTRPQTEILPEHLRFLDTALDLCDRTDGLPDDARFRWTCEVSWPVREFLRIRPREQVERLVRRAREGRIEVTALLLNGTDLLDERGLLASLQPVAEFRAAGIPVTTAMQNDVNGLPWSLADHARRLGIEFVSMGQHGHRARIPFDRPTCFWWESPAGERVLAFRADHYHTGNFHGVHTGRVEVVEAGLLRYLAELGVRGYPLDRIAIQHGGYPTDNAPPSMASSELVRAWNERYVWPRLRCSIARDFLRVARDARDVELAVFRTAWPDWWSDGYGSAPRETAAARRAQARLAAVESLLAAARLAGQPVGGEMLREVGLARDALLFYAEHTFGADESIRDPLSANSALQWALKAGYAWEATRRVAWLEGAASEVRIAGLPLGGAEPRLLVFNPLGFDRAGPVELYADDEALPRGRPFRIVDDAGRALPCQLLRSRAEGSYWVIQAPRIPALGVQTFRVAVDPSGTVPAPRPRAPGLVLENRHFRLEVDPATAAIASLVDRGRGLELVDRGAPWQLGQLIHERLGDREQLEAFTLDDYQRSAMSGIEVEGVLAGPVWDALGLRGDLPGCEEVRCEIRLHHGEARVELRYSLRKRRDFAPEALYVAFPWRVDGGELVYAASGGTVRPVGGILPGAATDWLAMLDFVSVRNAAGQVVLSSPEVPLFQPGGIRTGTFAETLGAQPPHLVSWVLNNYWTTNFLAASEGGLEFGYTLGAGADPSTGAAGRFGRAVQMPLIGRIEGRRVADGGRAPVLPGPPSGVELIGIWPARAEGGVVLLYRECEGRPAALDFGARGGVDLVDPLEAVLEAEIATLAIPPFGSACVLLRPERR